MYIYFVNFLIFISDNENLLYYYVVIICNKYYFFVFSSKIMFVERGLRVIFFVYVYVEDDILVYVYVK